MTHRQERLSLATLFASWAPGEVKKTFAKAQELIARHGSINRARDRIAELSGGNVSLQCRAYFQPIDHMLAAMEKGYAL